jgi:hypothetical protein
MPACAEPGELVGAARKDRIREIAELLLGADDALRNGRWRRPLLASGVREGPAFIFEDHSEIPMSPPDSHTLEYRMAWLAKGADLVGLAGARVPAFERYLSLDLALGGFEAIEATGNPGAPLAQRFLEDRSALEELASRAKSGGGLTIFPFISSHSVWVLGARLVELTSQPVRVAGPSPALSERVNNKLWFTQRVRELLGAQALPRTHVASDERELIAHLERLADLGGTLVVKVPSSSGGRGIVTIDASFVGSSREGATVEWLQSVLSASGWDGRYPLVVGQWEEPVVGSPSVQVWIPNRGTGAPLVEAIVDQVVVRGRFVGASRSEIPERVQAQLAIEGMELALLLQRLGYFGRCSFDALLLGKTVGEASVRWLECNGRWSGVSTALTAVRRLVGSRHDLSFAVVQNESRLDRPRSFDQVIDVLGRDSFHRRSDGTGAVILAPRRVMAGSGLNMVVIERSTNRAQQLAEQLQIRFSAEPRHQSPPAPGGAVSRSRPDRATLRSSH